jgi:hypothetical protein
MLKVIPIKLFACLLLAVMLFSTMDGVFQSARAAAVATPAAEPGCQVSLHAGSPSDCPCAPNDQGGASGHCDDCEGCGCGASLFGQLFLFVYHPITEELRFLDHPRFVPEVFLTKFIPPPNLA